jgi:hypothetical protein
MYRVANIFSMKMTTKIKALLCLLYILFQLPAAQAQLSGSDVFLQGKYIEVGIAPNGAFGSAAAAPAGYHARTGSSTGAPGILGFVADPDKDGWSAGTPNYIGDFFTPGNPQEGWDIEINGLRGKAWRGLNAGETGTGFSGLLTGSNTSFVTSGRKKTGTWTGTMGDLAIVQQTSLDTERLFFTITISLKNTGDTTLTNVYYNRTVDPDNRAAMDPPVTSPHFMTRNRIMNQLPNPDNDILVSAMDTVHNSFLGLGTKDCRAKCYTLFIAGDLHPVGTLKDIFAQSPTVRKLFKKDTSVFRDAGMGLIFNIGSLAPGDSTSLTYTYILKEGDLDTALVQTKPTWLSSAITYKSGDTIRGCKDAVIPAAINNGDGLNWGAWSVTTGLSATSGRINNITVQSTAVTYKVVGISSACYNDTMTLTIAPYLPLPLAPVVSSPVNYCIGGTAAALTATGTALKWYTAASGGSPVAAPVPSTASTGSVTYYVSQTTTGSCESPRSPIVTTVHALPAAPAVTTPLGYCQGATAAALTASGPNLKWYTAASGGSPVSTPTPSTATSGSTIYYVSQTSAAATGSCEGPRAALTVTINATPAAPAVISPVQLCQDGPSSALTATGINLKWYIASSGGSSITTPTPPTISTGTTNYYVSQTTDASAGSCESPRSLIAVTVNTIPAAPDVASPLYLCIGGPATTLSATGSNLKWYTASSGGTGSSTAPSVTPSAVSSTDYYVSQTTGPNCESSRATLTVSVQALPLVSISSLSVSGFIICKNQSTTLKATAAMATAYQWAFAATNITGATKDTVHASKTGTWGVTVTDIYGCKGKASVFVQEDTSKRSILTPTEASICHEGSALLTCSPGYLTYTFKWMKDWTPVTPATPTANMASMHEAETYRVIVTNSFGCLDTTNTAVISYYPVPVKPVITKSGSVLHVAAIYRYYQWYRDSKIIYGANKSSLNTVSSGLYHVQVTDENGCMNYSDTVSYTQATGLEQAASATQVNIYPNPTRDIVYIEAPFEVQISVTDMSGRMILAPQPARSVSLGNYADGLYLLRICDLQGSLIRVEKLYKRQQ